MIRPMSIVVPPIQIRTYIPSQPTPPFLHNGCFSNSQHNFIPILKYPTVVSTNVSNGPSVNKMNQLYIAPYQELTSGRFDTSELLCQKIMTENGESVEGYIIMALCSFAQRRIDKAVRYCHKAISIDSRRPEAFVILGYAAIESNRPIEAIEYFRIALSVHPDSLEAIIGLSKCLILQNQIDAAINCLLVGIQRYPDAPILYMEMGVLLKSSGRVLEAKKCFERLVEIKPNACSAWLNLGHIYVSAGQQWLALHHFEKAVAAEPSSLEAYLLYAGMLKDLRLNDRAILVYMKALSLYPNSSPLNCGLACVYHDIGLFDLAIDTFMTAIYYQPNNPDTYCNLANTYKDKGLSGEAEHFYKMAITICSTHSDSYNNLANIYREQGRLAESLQFYSKALEISPDFAAAHSNIATIYQQFGNIQQSIIHYQRAISINPNLPETYSLLGNVYKETGNYKGSLECYSRIIQLNPLSAEAHAQIGGVYKDVGNIPDAINYFKISLKFKPDFPDVYSNLVHCYIMICDWYDYDNRVQKLIEIVIEQLKNRRPPSIHPHHTMLYPLEPLQRKAISATHANFCFERAKLLGFLRPYVYRGLENNRLKIGYVSSDFCNHPTSHLMQSVPGLHDRSKIEVFCFSLTSNDDSSFRKKLEREAEHFIDVSLIPTFGDIADIINHLGINILLNLNGYTKGAKNEVFALKPAPIQVMYLGYPGTSAADYMDYIITDKNTSPLSHQDFYSEKYAYMPNSFFIGDHANMFPHVLTPLSSDTIKNSFYDEFPDIKCTTDDQRDLGSIKNVETLNSYIQFHLNQRIAECDNCRDVGDRVPAQINWKLDKSILGISPNHFVFCNFNQLYKLDPSTFLCWCRILARTPNSVLWLLRFPKFGESNLKELARSQNICADRIIFTEVALKEEHVRRGQIADVCLDTLICNGHTTGMDVLWAGCPIITLPGDCFASRVGTSLMHSIGCEELVAKNIQEYEDIAVRLGTDSD